MELGPNQRKWIEVDRVTAPCLAVEWDETETMLNWLVGQGMEGWSAWGHVDRPNWKKLTLGRSIVLAGDWIVKLPSGEFCHCTAFEFTKRYRFTAPK